ncbi:RING-type E3 ubiquitin-protein ligase PPIL2-like isoform X2 [Symsagittifera roscoffensis]|uniref:RING-type E3 ubiquitin-protein ligase PPIL2-like isoform X2 n=1 Tax=Symsagittifera roscoffensis TaxID=84072 RepID=UPI00307BD5E7
MGKKQHQGDKTYVSANEYAWYFGGKNAEKLQAAKGMGFRRLPFDHCALSMQPFTTPFATRDGYVFEISSILPFLKRNGQNPVTGKKLSSEDLIALHFSKNKKDQYHCPITYKVFTNSSFIVAIATSGNVYSMEAVNELNLKQKNMKDLIDDSSFKKSNIITIQDPNNVDKYNINNFYFVKNAEEVDEGGKSNEDMLRNLNRSAVNSTANHVIAELDKSFSQKREEFAQKVLNEETPKNIVSGAVSKLDKKKDSQKGQLVDKLNSAHYSTGRVAASLTSTAFDVSTKQQSEILDEYTVKYKYVKKKGYARLVTNYGDLNLELFCQDVPKTCENFMKHLVSGYYKNTIFHRLIKHFVLQGGDPTGTGTGGQSSFPGGEPFADEFKPNLTHSARGTLSMANSGPDSNKSQFFVTFRPCQNLDGKHTVFGKLVGGMDTLSKIEQVKTDSKDKPLDDGVRILDTVVFVNPFEEAEALIEKMRNEEKRTEDEKKVKEEREQRKQQQLVKYKTSGVGQYLNISKLKRDFSSQEPKSSQSKVGSSDISKSNITSVLSEETQFKLAAKKQKLGSNVSRTFGNSGFSAW